MCNRLIPLVIAIVVIIVICVLIFRWRFEDSFERGAHLPELYTWVTVSVVLLVVIYFTTRSHHSHLEYGVGSKLRERYENAVDNYKAKSKEKQRVRIAKQHGLRH